MYSKLRILFPGPEIHKNEKYSNTIIERPDGDKEYFKLKNISSITNIKDLRKSPRKRLKLREFQKWDIMETGQIHENHDIVKKRIRRFSENDTKRKLKRQKVKISQNTSKTKGTREKYNGKKLKFRITSSKENIKGLNEIPKKNLKLNKFRKRKDKKVSRINKITKKEKNKTQDQSKNDAKGKLKKINGKKELPSKPAKNTNTRISNNRIQYKRKNIHSVQNVYIPHHSLENNVNIKGDFQRKSFRPNHISEHKDIDNNNSLRKNTRKNVSNNRKPKSWNVVSKTTHSNNRKYKAKKFTSKVSNSTIGTNETEFHVGHLVKLLRNKLPEVNNFWIHIKGYVGQKPLKITSQTITQKPTVKTIHEKNDDNHKREYKFTQVKPIAENIKEKQNKGDKNTGPYYLERNKEQTKNFMMEDYSDFGNDTQTNISKNSYFIIDEGVKETDDRKTEYNEVVVRKSSGSKSNNKNNIQMNPEKVNKTENTSQINKYAEEKEVIVPVIYKLEEFKEDSVINQSGSLPNQNNTIRKGKNLDKSNENTFTETDKKVIKVETPEDEANFPKDTIGNTFNKYNADNKSAIFSNDMLNKTEKDSKVRFKIFKTDTAPFLQDISLKYETPYEENNYREALHTYTIKNEPLLSNNESVRTKLKFATDITKVSDNITDKIDIIHDTELFNNSDSNKSPMKRINMEKEENILLINDGEISLSPATSDTLIDVNKYTTSNWIDGSETGLMQEQGMNENINTFKRNKETDTESTYSLNEVYKTDYYSAKNNYSPNKEVIIEITDTFISEFDVTNGSTVTEGLSFRKNHISQRNNTGKYKIHPLDLKSKNFTSNKASDNSEMRNTKKYANEHRDSNGDTFTENMRTAQNNVINNESTQLANSEIYNTNEISKLDTMVNARTSNDNMGKDFEAITVMENPKTVMHISSYMKENISVSEKTESVNYQITTRNYDDEYISRKGITDEISIISNTPSYLEEEHIEDTEQYGEGKDVKVILRGSFSEKSMNESKVISYASGKEENSESIKTNYYSTNTTSDLAEKLNANKTNDFEFATQPWKSERFSLVSKATTMNLQKHVNADYNTEKKQTVLNAISTEGYQYSTFKDDIKMQSEFKIIDLPEESSMRNNSRILKESFKKVLHTTEGDESSFPPSENISRNDNKDANKKVKTIDDLKSDNNTIAYNDTVMPNVVRNLNDEETTDFKTISKINNSLDTTVASSSTSASFLNDFKKSENMGAKRNISGRDYDYPEKTFHDIPEAYTPSVLNKTNNKSPIKSSSEQLNKMPLEQTAGKSNKKHFEDLNDVNLEYTANEKNKASTLEIKTDYFGFSKGSDEFDDRITLNIGENLSNKPSVNLKTAPYTEGLQKTTNAPHSIIVDLHKHTQNKNQNIIESTSNEEYKTTTLSEINALHLSHKPNNFNQNYPTVVTSSELIAITLKHKPKNERNANLTDNLSKNILKKFSREHKNRQIAETEKDISDSNLSIYMNENANVKNHTYNYTNKYFLHPELSYAIKLENGIKATTKSPEINIKHLSGTVSNKYKNNEKPDFKSLFHALPILLLYPSEICNRRKFQNELGVIADDHLNPIISNQHKYTTRKQHSKKEEISQKDNEGYSYTKVSHSFLKDPYFFYRELERNQKQTEDSPEIEPSNNGLPFKPRMSVLLTSLSDIFPKYKNEKIMNAHISKDAFKSSEYPHPLLSANSYSFTWWQHPFIKLCGIQCKRSPFMKFLMNSHRFENGIPNYYSSMSLLSETGKQSYYA